MDQFDLVVLALVVTHRPLPFIKVWRAAHMHFAQIDLDVFVPRSSARITVCAKTLFSMVNVSD